MVVSSASANAAVTIARPSFGVPEFAEPGGTFRAEVLGSSGLNTNQWAAFLINDLRTWTGKVERAEYGRYIDNNSTTGYQLTVRVPADISPEVFKLNIQHPVGGEATNRHAVSIVRSFADDFYILHYADPQAQTNDATAASGLTGGNGCIQEIYWHTPVFNLINPRFLIDTGDELDNSYVSGAHYEAYKDAMDTLTVPVLVTRGNNDITANGSDWQGQIGQSTYSITMGSFYVLMNDYTVNTDYAWLTNNYASSFSRTGITFRLIGQHYYSTNYAFSPHAGQYPDLMLIGHVHSSATIQTTPYTILRTVHGCDYGKTAMIELFRGATNWACPSLTNQPTGTAPGGNVIQPVGDWGGPRLTMISSLPNDGSAFSNTITIINNIAKRFWDGRVRFLMKHAPLGYKVGGGVELCEYDYAAGSNTAVLVKVDITSLASTVVSISRVDSDGDGLPDDWELGYFPSLTNATATSDSDHDGFSDLQEYMADTNPTNGQSRLAFTAASDVAGANAFVVRWQSVTSRWYNLWWTSNLFNNFAPLASNLPPDAPENAYTDTLHGAEGTSFYRVTTQLP